MPRAKEEKRDTSVVWWCFTHNNPPAPWVRLWREWCEANCKEWMFQLEKGEETGTLHVQGVIGLKVKARLETLRNKSPFPGVHWSKTNKKDWAIAYANKNETCVCKGDFDGVGEFETELRPLPDLYPWQKWVVEDLRGPANDRTVTWIYEKDGNKGKSILCRYLLIKRQALMCGGSYRDALASIALHMEETACKAHPKGLFPSIVVFDLKRDEFDHVSYKAIEAFKNGQFFNSKYKSGQKVLNPCHVLVLANSPPDESKLSADRWDIRNYWDHESPHYKPEPTEDEVNERIATRQRTADEKGAAAVAAHLAGADGVGAAGAGGGGDNGGGDGADGAGGGGDGVGLGGGGDGVAGGLGEAGEAYAFGYFNVDLEAMEDTEEED